MASKLELVEYIADQISGAGSIRYRKMFGEYGLYCDERIIGLVCDNQLFLKITDDVKQAYPSLPEAAPYDGAKNHFRIEDLDDWERLTDIVIRTANALPMPKKKKAKG